METHGSPHTHAPRGSFSSLLRGRSLRRKVPFSDGLLLFLPRSYCSFPFCSPYPLNFCCKAHRSTGPRGAFSYCLQPGDSNECNSTCFSTSLSLSTQIKIPLHLFAPTAPANAPAARPCPSPRPGPARINCRARTRKVGVTQEFF